MKHTTDIIRICNLPTIFVYHQGELKHQLMTIRSLGDKSMTADDLEWWRASQSVLETELDENPRDRRASGGGGGGGRGSGSPSKTGVFHAARMTGLDSDDDVSDEER